MRIACLQFAPQVGDISNNLNRADAVLSRANVRDIDLLVLPELAFTGYNFRSLQHISPYLENTAAGITSLWARTTALKHNCVVVAGYPEKVDIAPKWPASPEYYNSAIIVSGDGETIANYRKSFLFYTDETWALEGPDGFFDSHIEGLGHVAVGICMDINPYKFEAPWIAWEFAQHILHRSANLVVISMAWLTREDVRSFSRVPREPDMETLSYWLARLEPVIRAESEDEIICVFANRCGQEDEVVYAGTSAVLGIQDGEVKVYGILGRGEKELLVVDTSKRPQMHLVSDRRKHDGSLLSDKTYTEGIDRRSHSSSGSAIDSSGSIASAQSTSTGQTLAEASCELTLDPQGYGNLGSTSPYQPHFPQHYFVERSSSHSVDGAPMEARPDTSRHSSQAQQSTTPHRPPSPKSRNTSRSRGRTMLDSPVAGHLEDARITREQAQQNLERVRSPSGEFRAPSRVSRRPPMRGSSRDSYLPADRSSSAVIMSPGPSSAPSTLERDDQSPSKSNPSRTGNSSFRQPAFLPIVKQPLDQESSFTRNNLGPRSQHIISRPSSVNW